MDHTFSEHYLNEQEATHGNFVLALIAALAMAVLGSVMWMGIVMITGWHPGPFALVIAIVVGVAVRLSGHGAHFTFGLVGVFFTLLGCLLGEMGVTLQLATTPFFDLYGVLTHVDLISMAAAIIGKVSPMMMAVYGISSYIAYSLSIFVRK